MARLCLVGAGNIARVHAEALRRLPGRTIVAIVDPNADAAARLAREVGGAATYASVADALADDGFDRAHVLVPPDLHAATAEALLRAGKPVLLEKPLATGGAECDALLAASSASGAVLGVNQNFVHHPAFAALRRQVEAGQHGRPNFVSCLYNVPLRQMQARQFGHWMFREPGNILLEQAVHPLSQLLVLAGAPGRVTAIAGPPMEIAPGVPFVRSLDVALAGARLPAQLRFAVGQNFPFWQVTCVCDDGVVVADIFANRLFSYGRTQWLEAVDGMVSGLRTAGALAGGSVAGLARYALSTAKLRERSDWFYVSMKASIAAFHEAADAGRAPELDGTFGATLVGVCETIRDLAMPAAGAPRAAEPAAAPVVPDTAPLVAIIGGTGFIGTHTVRRFLDQGWRVRVMARSLHNLPDLFAQPGVTLLRGDIRKAADVAAAVAGTKVVVNLAHGGGGATFEAIRNAMVGGAETVARACLAAGIERLVYVGSIASLYLGGAGRVTDATPPDPMETQRGDYAHAKVLADRLMLRMHAEDRLPVVILRPGVVVGEGGPPFHSGLGLYNNDQHCIGWNAGSNALPFVLVEDTADAIVRAATAPGIEGRAYNIVGDVRLSARDYTAELARALGRPLRFHPQSPVQLWAEDYGKWLVKRATGRQVPPPALRDFRSRGMTAAFDTAGAQRDLGWHPVADRARFLERAVAVHA